MLIHTENPKMMELGCASPKNRWFSSKNEFKTRSPRDPGVPKRGADTLAKMFSDFLDTQTGYRTRRADSFLLLVNLEKIDIRSIMKH